MGEPICPEISNLGSTLHRLSYYLFGRYSAYSSCPPRGTVCKAISSYRPQRTRPTKRTVGHLTYHQSFNLPTHGHDSILSNLRSSQPDPASNTFRWPTAAPLRNVWIGPLRPVNVPGVANGILLHYTLYYWGQPCRTRSFRKYSRKHNGYCLCFDPNASISGLGTAPTI